MPGLHHLLSRNLHEATAFAEALPPPRPPTQVRVVSPELHDAIQEKAMATERARSSGKPLEQAVIEEARKIEAKRQGPGPGPVGLSGPAGAGYGRGGYDAYQQGYGGHGLHGPHGHGHGHRHGPPPFTPFMPNGSGRTGRGGHRSGPLQGGGQNGQSSRFQATLSGGSDEKWKAGPPDIVPWHGDVQPGPCDPDDVFSVREQVQKIAPYLIGSGCEKYVMDADKMLNDLPTDRGSDMIPACKNNYLVKSTAKMVYNVEKCAERALAKAEHVNVEQEAQIKRIARAMQDQRLHVLLPINSYSAPAKFAGHAHMSAKDWENFNRSDAAGAMARNWGGSAGAARAARGGMHGHGGPLHGQQFQGQYGATYGDTYGSPPHPEPPAQPGAGGKAAGKGLTPLTPKEQEVKQVIDHAKELAKANVDKVGPFKRGEHMEELPPPSRRLKPIYPYPQPPNLEGGTASAADFPVYSAPDAPDVELASPFPIDAADTFAVHFAFLFLRPEPSKAGRRRQKGLANEFLEMESCVI